jgi:hypothetical protein
MANVVIVLILIVIGYIVTNYFEYKCGFNDGYNKCMNDTIKFLESCEKAKEGCEENEAG